jgi:pimeloyl-ACP methyl ester carboxylesterase
VLAKRLRAAGHEVVAPDLPLHDPDATYEGRAQPAVDALSEAPDPVVVVGPSLGAAYVPLVPAALLVYLCPAPTGPFDGRGRTRPIRDGFPFPPGDGDGVSGWDPSAAIELMYPRLPRELAASCAARLRPGASAAGPYPLTEHPDIPSALIYATDDEIFEPEWEREIAQEILGVDPIEIQGGHFPMLESPEALAELLSSIPSGPARRP